MTREELRQKIEKILWAAYEPDMSPNMEEVSEEIVALMTPPPTGTGKITFIYEHLDTQEQVREHIQECEGRHTQQAMYSTFHDCLTQVCFSCKKIRSSLPNYPYVKN